MDERIRATNKSAAVQEYQDTLRQFKNAIAALSALERSLTVEVIRFNVTMRTVVLSRGITIIPDEILARILIEANNERQQRYRPKTAPESLRLVCKRFYEVVNTTPAMWSFISSTMPTRQFTERIRRSGSVALTVDLNCMYRRGTTLASFVDAALLHASRWKNVELTRLRELRYHTYVREKLVNLDLPQVNRITIDSGDCIYESWILSNLRRFACHDFIPAAISNMANLVDCELLLSSGPRFAGPPNYSLRKLSTFLSALQTLQTLRFRFHRANTVEADTLQPIDFPCLERLFFTFDFASIMDNEPGVDTGAVVEAFYRFLGQIKAPQLEDFDLSFVDLTEWEDHLQDLTDGLMRSLRNSSKPRRLRLAMKKPFYRFKFKLSTIVTNAILSLTSLESITIEKMHVVYMDEYAPAGQVAEYPRPSSGRLRRLRLKDCELSNKSVRYLLNVLTDPDVFPDFEALVLIRCVGFVHSELEEICGWEYIVTQED